MLRDVNSYMSVSWCNTFLARPVGPKSKHICMAGKGRGTSTDESGEVFSPIDKPEDLPEMHQRRYAEIMDELKTKVLAMYGTSRHGGVVLRGVPSSLLDEVDLMTPS